jgi:hypothetical protein
LTVRRASESETYNDVIRELLGLKGKPSTAQPVKPCGKPWAVSGTSFPEGTEFASDYKGKNYSGSVKNGKLELADGHRFTTPSAAAVHITGSNVNGWRFWKCRLPGSREFLLMERLRGKFHE